MRIRDWSSDVCSSDLVARVVDGVVTHGAGEHGQVLRVEIGAADERLVLVDVGDDGVDLGGRVAELGERQRERSVDEVGRASWREGVCPYGWNAVVAGSLNKKTKHQKKVYKVQR